MLHAKQAGSPGTANIFPGRQPPSRVVDGKNSPRTAVRSWSCSGFCRPRYLRRDRSLDVVPVGSWRRTPPSCGQ
eukprot:5942221-Prymnesium_polylepis.1